MDFNDRNFYYRCDAVSGDYEVIAAAVCNRDGSVNKRYVSKENPWGQIFLLDKIEIQEKYQNLGVGSTIIEFLPKMLIHQFDWLTGIFFCASDYSSAHKYGFDSEEYKQGCQKLIDFYKKRGYRIVKDNVMYQCW